jgi:2',3'-cyclic-nucleotide 2'-phosphodiesterase (5'-nucleotidase family)
VKNISFALIVLMLGLWAGCGTTKEIPTNQLQLEPLTVLHWNDFHAQNVPFKVTLKDTVRKVDSTYYVGGTAALLGYIGQIKDQRGDVVVLNAGDDCTGTPISTFTDGRSQVELMNIINPDAATLGNHEFDYGLENVEKNIASAKYPIVNANLFDKRKGKLFLPPYIVKWFGKLKVGIIGVIVRDLPLHTVRENVAGLEMLNIYQVVRKYIAEIKSKEETNLIMVLSHLGVDEDKVLADSVQGVDVIVGGHSHTALFTPVKENRTIICQAGSRGRWLGELDLMVDLSGDSVYSYKGQLIETAVSKVAPNPVAAAMVAELEKKVDQLMGGVIGKLVVDWTRQGGLEINIGNWETDVMREFCSTDIAFQNTHGIRKDLPAGNITIRDIWEINPFGNEFAVFKVDGATLRNMMEWQADRKGELMQISGMKYRFDSSKPSGSKIVSIEVGGQPVEDGRTYSIATNSYVAGHLYNLFGLPEKDVKVDNLSKVDRDVFVEAVKNQKTIRSLVEGRIIDVAQKQ